MTYESEQLRSLQQRVWRISKETRSESVRELAVVLDKLISIIHDQRTRP